MSRIKRSMRTSGKRIANLIKVQQSKDVPADLLCRATVQLLLPIFKALGVPIPAAARRTGRRQYYRKRRPGTERSSGGRRRTSSQYAIFILSGVCAIGHALDVVALGVRLNAYQADRTDLVSDLSCCTP